MYFKCSKVFLHLTCQIQNSKAGRGDSGREIRTKKNQNKTVTKWSQSTNQPSPCVGLTRKDLSFFLSFTKDLNYLNMLLSGSSYTYRKEKKGMG